MLYAYRPVHVIGEAIGFDHQRRPVELKVVRLPIHKMAYDNRGDIELLMLTYALEDTQQHRWCGGQVARLAHEQIGSGPDYIFLINMQATMDECVTAIRIGEGTFGSLYPSKERALNSARITSLPC